MFNTEIPNAIVEMFMENTLRGVKAFGMLQEHNEKMLRTALDNSRIAREEGLKMAQQFSEMARENQRQFATVVEKTVQASTEGYKQQYEAFMAKVSQN